LSLAKAYFGLTKPERTLANVMTAIAGFLFASEWKIDWKLFLALTAGSYLVIASACVFNNYLDRRLDEKMSRTRNRVLVSGEILSVNALFLGCVLAIAGFFILSFTNQLTVEVIIAGFIGYVFVYGYAKRHTEHSTLIGTIPGAASLVAGYTAVKDNLDTAALALFLIMLSWQMVHFYAIAIYRLKDYKAAGIPIFPLKRGVRVTKFYMVFYLVIFGLSAVWLTQSSSAGYIFLAVVLVLGVLWMQKTLRGFSSIKDGVWARGVFIFSLIVLLVLSLMLSVGSVLP